MPIVVMGLLSACYGDKPPTDLSEKPVSTQTTVTQTLPHLSHIGIRARVKTEDFSSLVRQELPETVIGDGTERMCKRVIGLKVCGTAQWEYQINRGEDISVSAVNDKIELRIPLEFSGIAGIQGDVAKALNLSRLDFNGALDADLTMGFDLDKDWCPIIDTQISYVWTRKPRVKWTGGIELNVQSHVDEAIAKQLADLQPKLKEAIDCEQFREMLQTHWRSYSFPIELSANETMHLNLTPSGFAFSGVHTETDQLGVTFTLIANTSLEPEAIEINNVELPEVQQIDYDIGTTEFELLVRASYNQLQSYTAPSLIGKNFTSKTAAGLVSVRVNNLDISANNDGITVALAFDADLPATRRNTPGTVFLTAKPHIESDINVISLRDIKISPVLDSKLWKLLATVFEQKIITAIQEKAILDLTPKIQELEKTLLAQLTDSASTSGLSINAQELSIAITRLTPEKEALAAIMQARVQLDIDVPLAVLSSGR